MNGRPWTPEEDQYMREHYPDELGNDVAKALRRPMSLMYQRARILGLKKSEFFKLSEFSGRLNGKQGRNNWFPKGHVPANKGKKMLPGQYEKCKATMFRKGNNPQNHKLVGTISERSNYKRGSTYMYIKIAEPRTWVMLHRYNWENVYGPIPRGMNLVFKDGDFRNCQVENLELITNDELMRRNTIHNRYPEDLKKAIMTLGALKRKVREYEEHN